MNTDQTRADTNNLFESAYIDNTPKTTWELELNDCYAGNSRIMPLLSEKLSAKLNYDSSSVTGA